VIDEVPDEEAITEEGWEGEEDWALQDFTHRGPHTNASNNQTTIADADEDPETWEEGVRCRLQSPRSWMRHASQDGVAAGEHGLLDERERAQRSIEPVS